MSSKINHRVIYMSILFTLLLPKLASASNACHNVYNGKIAVSWSGQDIFISSQNGVSSKIRIQDNPGYLPDFSFTIRTISRNIGARSILFVVTEKSYLILEANSKGIYQLKEEVSIDQMIPWEPKEWDKIQIFSVSNDGSKHLIAWEGRNLDGKPFLHILVASSNKEDSGQRMAINRHFLNSYGEFSKIQSIEVDNEGQFHITYKKI